MSLALSPSTATSTKSMISSRYQCRSAGRVCDRSRKALAAPTKSRSRSQSPLQTSASCLKFTSPRVKMNDVYSCEYRDDTEDQENRGKLGNSPREGFAKDNAKILSDPQWKCVTGPLEQRREVLQEDCFPPIKEAHFELEVPLKHSSVPRYDCERDASGKKRVRHAEKDCEESSDDEENGKSFEMAYNAEKSRREKASVLRNARNTTNPIEDDDEVLLYIPNVKLYEFLPAGLQVSKQCTGLDESKVSEGSGNNWEFLGVGNMKFLKHLEDGITFGTVRLTMRDHMNRLLVDQTMEQDVFCRPFTNDGRATRYVWTGFDVAEFNCRRTLAAKFASQDVAKRWVECFHRSKDATKDARLNPERRESPDDDDITEYLESLSISISESLDLQTTQDDDERERCPEKAERKGLRVGVKKRRVSSASA